MTLGVYVKGSTTPVEGTIKFSGHFKFAARGRVVLEDKAKVEFSKVTVLSGNRESRFLQTWRVSPSGDWISIAERIAITDTLILDADVELYGFTVSKSFTLKGDGILTVTEGLTVKSGATLSLSQDLHVLPKTHKLSNADLETISEDDPRARLAVDGMIEGLGSIVLAYPKADRVSFYSTADYYPTNGVDGNDCFRVTGGGTLSSIIAIASGTICVELKQVGKVEVAGSIEDTDSGIQDQNYTTDLIFLNDVVVDGNVEQWGDSRVVFEKTATIKGDVILRDGTLTGSGPIGDDDFGVARDVSVRIGDKVAGVTGFVCIYEPKDITDEEELVYWGGKIPGVQFEHRAMIEGDLDVRSNTLNDVMSTNENDTQCAPRVLFTVPPVKSTGPARVDIVSEIGGDLVIEDTLDFRDRGRVRLVSHSTSNNARIVTHSVRVGGDLIASGTTIGMKTPKTFSNAGMCGATKVTPGSEIVLTGTGSHVVRGTLTLDALQIHEELDIQNGPLTVKHLHVQPGGQLNANGNVVVSETLLLEGDGLNGTLSDASTIKTLVYSSQSTDLVQSAAMADILDAFTLTVGTGELRLDQVTKTKNLGLCSGTLVLREAGTDTDSTLTVHDQITVQNGIIQKDPNRPGSIATDKASSPNEADRYILKYITPGKRTVTNALEWFDPRDVIVDHKSAEITVTGDRSLMGKLTVENGKLIVDGDLTVGTSPLHRVSFASTTSANLKNYSLLLSNASELHTKEDDVVVNGLVTLNDKSKLMTGGGDVHVLGRVTGGKYAHATALMTIQEGAMLDLGAGTLMLGPEITTKQNGLGDPLMVRLTLHGTLKGGILVPKGSKENEINVETIPGARKVLGPITFDGTKTPEVSGTGNASGRLELNSVDDKAKTLVIDSLSTMQGFVWVTGKKVEFTKDVHLSSTELKLFNDSTAFKGDLKVSGTGGLNMTENSNTAKRSVLIDGSFMQTKGTKTILSGVKLHPGTTKIVEGDFMVSDSTAAYETKKATTLILKGDVHYMKDTLYAKMEFKGEEAQEVKTGMKTELDSVVVDNAKGLKLASPVMQKKDATLTLRRGRIMNADTTATAKTHTWTVKNPQIEENLKGRTSALEAKKCGDDEDEACKFSISRGSVQSHASMVSFARHLEQGNSGDGALSGGYLFPVGMSEGKSAYYRPLMLQLPFDLSEAEAATVSVMTDSEERLGAPLTVSGTSGQSLTLDVHSDMFWKIEMDETLESEVNLRIVAAGIQNVSDVSGLRIVQWNCEWENPKLAGRYNATIAAGSFGVNDLLNGVVNLTQERITLETCTILGIAANGVENPINLEDLSGGRARLQFIHNLPLPAPVDVHLGDVRISSSLQFRDATAYRTFGAGSGYVLTIQPDGAPAEQAIKVPLPTLRNNRNYVAIAHGSVADPKALFMETRLTSSVTNKVDAILVHGSDGLGAVDVRVLDASDNLTPLMTLADNIPLNGKTSYLSLDASTHNVQVSSPNNEEELEVYRMDLSGYRNETLVLNLSGSKNDLRILGVDKNGMTFLPDVITGVETERAELPTEFALHGNYPNPFNPSTRIQFDLPETAQVRVQIVNMLGREVMSLPAQEFEAGANRSMEINAMNLASGTYLYRMIATGAEGRHVKTGRMTLVK